MKALSAQASKTQGAAAYVSGGRAYYLDEKGKLVDVEHQSAQPYLWPIAHNVRPAAQSLGVRRCEDCHATDAPFFFGDVAVDTPVVSAKKAVKKMVEFQDVNPVYMKLFAMSFVFRPWLKVVAVVSCAFLGAVLILYVFKALAHILKVLCGED